MNEVNAQQVWQQAINAYQTNNPKLAKKWVSQLTNLAVADGNTFLLAGIVDIQLQQWSSAENHLRKAVGAMPSNTDALMALASVLQNQGAAEQALPIYEKVAEIDPRNPQALHNMGVCLEDMGRALDALEKYEDVLTLDPNSELSLRACAPLLARLRRFEAAQKSYESLICRFPEDISLQLDFAEFLEQSNLAGQCEQAIPKNIDAQDKVSNARIYALRTQLLLRQDRYTEALEVLQSGYKSTNQDRLKFLEGKVLDRLGDYAAAMLAFEKANKAVSKHKRFVRISSEQVIEYVDNKISSGMPKLTDHFQNRGISPVFLVGLPRSGTTLINRMLNAHPDIQILEEVEALRLAETELKNSGSNDKAIVKYWEIVSQHIKLDENVIIVDKSPYHPMALDVVIQLFPQSKVVFALRHPYDSALSCFMQDFNPGPVNAQFLNLKSSAALCARFLKLMRQFELSRPQQVRRVYYEKLVRDFESEIRMLLTFIDLSWDEAISNYAEIASRSGPIMTASYSQVTKKVYDNAVYRWENYQPWIQQAFKCELQSMLGDFGYDADMQR